MWRKFIEKKKQIKDHNMAKIIDIQTGQDMSSYMDMLDTAEVYIKDIEARNNVKLEQSLKILKEIRWAASFNPQFRKDSFKGLAELLDDLYLDLNGEQC
jgi:hypothetical protein